MKEQERATEKLVIENFAGIEHMELEVGPFNVLIGPQASGKSICVKLLYFCRTSILVLKKTVEEGEGLNGFETRVKEMFSLFFPPSTWAGIVFNVSYESTLGALFCVKKNTVAGDVALEYSKQYIDISNRYAELTVEEISPESALDPQSPDPKEKLSKAFSSLISDNIGHVGLAGQFIVPAGRSFFSYLESNTFALLSEKYRLDPFMAEFGRFYESMKKLPGVGYQLSTPINDHIEELARGILCSKFTRDDKDEFLLHDEGRKVPLRYSSSGQQESLPLYIMLSAIINMEFTRKYISVIIEEPEAHLFPATQKNMAEFIALAFNNTSSPRHLIQIMKDKKPNRTLATQGLSQMLLTTHSPYILTSLNNLLYAYSLYKKFDAAGQEEKAKALEGIVPRSIAINPDEMYVYEIGSDGAKLIIDREEGVIQAEAIDKVSEEIGATLDSMLDLEFDQ